MKQEAALVPDESFDIVTESLGNPARVSVFPKGDGWKDDVVPLSRGEGDTLEHAIEDAYRKIIEVEDGDSMGSELG